MFNGFAFVLLFTGFCSSVDIKINDFKVTSLVPTTSSSSDPKSVIRPERNAPDPTTPLQCNTQLVDKILQVVLAMMNKNMEQQTQTSNIINLLTKIVKKKVDYFNEKETETMNNILNNLDPNVARDGPDAFPSSHALALLRILDIAKSFLHMVDELIPDDLFKQLSNKYPISYHRLHSKYILPHVVPSIGVKNKIGQATPIEHEIIDLKPNVAWDHSFNPTNYLDHGSWLNLEKEVNVPKPNKITGPNLSPLYDLPSSPSNNNNPVIPVQDNHEHINLSPNYDNHKERIHQLLPSSNFQSPNVEFTTEKYLVTEQLLHHPEIEIEPTLKQNEFTNYDVQPLSDIVTHEFSSIYNNQNLENNIPIVFREDKYDYLNPKHYNIIKDDVDYKYPVYDKNYIDVKSVSGNPTNAAKGLIYSLIPKETNLKSPGNPQIDVEFTTKSPMLFDNKNAMPYFYDKSANFNWNNNPWNDYNYYDKNISITDNGSSQPDQGIWIGNHTPKNDNQYLYNEKNDIIPLQNISPVFGIPNYKHPYLQPKPSGYNVEENLFPMIGHKVEPNVDSDVDQHYIKVNFTTKLPVSIDEAMNSNHYNNWKNPYPNGYGNIELTTRAPPIAIDGKYLYPIFNVLPKGDSYNRERNTNDGTWNHRYLTYYKPENKYRNNLEMFDKAPMSITEKTVLLNEFTNMDNSNRNDIENNNILINHNVIENVTPTNYAENLETTIKHFKHHVFDIPRTFPVNKVEDKVKHIKQVISPNPYYWNNNNPWNQHVKVTTKSTKPLDNILNSNHYNNWYNNKYSPYPQKQINKIGTTNYFPLNKFLFNQEKPSKIELHTNKYNIYGNANHNYDNLWNQHPSNENADKNDDNTNVHYFPLFYDFNTQKNAIKITTQHPYDFWKEETAQKHVNENENTIQNPNFQNLNYNDKNSDNLPSNSQHPWQLEIEVTTKYSIILHDVPDYEFTANSNFYPRENNIQSKRDGDHLDSGDLSITSRNIEPGSESEISTSSNLTENKSINNDSIKSISTIQPIVATHETYLIAKDNNESEEKTQTPLNDSTSSEDNSTLLNPTVVNILQNTGLEPEPEVIKLIEETIENVVKNEGINIDPILFESIEQLKRMINEHNLSIDNYIHILRTYHDIMEHFKLYGKVKPFLYLYHLINKNNTNPDDIVEITYLIKLPKLFDIYYYAKYHGTVFEIDQFLSQYTNMFENNEQFHMKLLSLCKIADVSPALKKVSKEDIDKLISRYGNVVKTNLINHVALRETLDHNKIKINDTDVISHHTNGNEENIKEIRIKVNNKPYHTIKTISDFKGTPIIEDKNSPKIDNLNDLNNPFRKIFPTHKLIQATNLASDPKKDRNEEINTVEKYLFGDFNKNYKNIKHIRSDSQSIPYKDTNEFTINTRSKFFNELQPLNHDPNIQIYRRDKHLGISSVKESDNDLNGKKRVPVNTPPLKTVIDTDDLVHNTLWNADKSNVYNDVYGQSMGYLDHTTHSNIFT